MVGVLFGLLSALFSSMSFAVGQTNISGEAQQVEVNHRIDMKTAEKVANQYLNERVIPYLYSDWKGASVQSPTLFYSSKDGTPAIYSMRVQRNNESLGYMLVGATKDVSPIVSVGKGTAPTENISIIQEMANKDIQSGQTLGSPQLLYGGPLDLGIRFDVFEDRKKAKHLTYNLMGKYRVESLPFPVHDAGYKNQAKEQWGKHLRKSNTNITPFVTVTSKDLNVVSYNQNDLPANQEDSGCGPAAGADIMDYWHLHGYPQLQSSSDELKGVELMTQLYGEMGTTSWGTTIYNWSSGMVVHASNHGGYHFQSQEITSDLWNNLVNEINAGRPLGMYFGLAGSPYSYHFVAARGWLYDSDYGTKKYHVNTWGTDSWNDWASASGFSLIYVHPGN